MRILISGILLVLTVSCSSAAPSSHAAGCKTNSDCSSTPATPYCGADGTCVALNPSYRYIFITSGNYLPGTPYTLATSTTDGTFASVTDADRACQGTATAASLPGIWKAWIADSKNSAVVHVNDFVSSDTLPIYLIDGTTQIATSVSNLASATTIQNAICQTESGATTFCPQQTPGVKWLWTGAGSSKVVAAPTTTDCIDWAELVDNVGIVGSSNAKDSGWFETTSATCTNQGVGFYCIQVDHN